MKQLTRICSLLPSATEIVCALGLGDNLVGITHECDYPTSIDGIPVVTKSLIDQSENNSSQIDSHIKQAAHDGSGIYSINSAIFRSITPDLILTQELCEVCAVSYRSVQESVRKLDGAPEILSLEPKNITDILDSIEIVGRLTGSSLKAQSIGANIRERLNKIKKSLKDMKRTPKVLTLEWLNPPFIGGHWVPEMISAVGAMNAYDLTNQPSREVKWQELLQEEIEIVVLAVCGFDLERTLVEFPSTKLGPFWDSYSGSVYAVDGSAYFSRPGPRIINGIEILAEIIHPSIFPRKSPAGAWRQVF